jgi:DNA-binding transcriptional regulator YdaS (Cro superfamily)
MDLKTYLSQERGRAAALAKTIGAHSPDVSRWADGTRPVPVHFGAPIEKATEGAVTRKELFPNDWATIWPELDHGNRRATDSAPSSS